MNHRPKMKLRGLRRRYGNRYSQQLQKLPGSVRGMVSASRLASRDLGLFVEVLEAFGLAAREASRSIAAARALRAEAQERHAEETAAWGVEINASPALVADVIAQTLQHTAGTATDWAIARTNISALAGMSRI